MASANSSPFFLHLDRTPDKPSLVVMTVGGESDPLRDLRDALKSPVDDVDSLSFLLSSTLSALGLHSSSLISSSPTTNHLKSIRRYLPSIQISLLISIITTFQTALNDREQQLLRTFFVPTKDTSNLALKRNIALTAYQTFSSLFSTKSITPLPRESREYVMDTSRQLARYGVSDLYWAVWSNGDGREEGSKEASARDLGWEEAVSTLVGLPAKVGNAVGRWKAEGWSNDIPNELVSKHVFIPIA